MRTHATAQHIGDRSHQCDATATFTHRGTRAYALLDGIGSSGEVRDWTRSAARHLARAAAHQGALGGLRALHAVTAAERARDRWGARDEPCAVAVVATVTPSRMLEVAWCGDARAYILTPRGVLYRLTTDHNMRQLLLGMGLAADPYARNQVTSYLGDIEEKPALGAVTRGADGRLLLASDGAYEPLEDSCRDITAYLCDTPAQAARALVTAAIEHAPAHADNATVLVADLGIPF